jgi:hypothetical protein
MKNDALYKVARFLGSPFAYKCIGLENIHDNGPAIYVANHLGSVRPIEIMLSVPVRFYPWAIAEMTDPQRAPLYLYNDFIHPALHLNGRFGMAMSAVISRLAVGLINGLGSVSVDRNRGRYMEPLRRSLVLLAEGKNLLILPEDPAGPPDPETHMRPFLCGFILLCSMYQRLTDTPLPIHPLAASSQSRTVSIGRAVFLEPPGSRRRDDICRVCNQLQEDVGELCRSL